jgi:hypothetical protein
MGYLFLNPITFFHTQTIDDVQNWKRYKIITQNAIILNLFVFEKIDYVNGNLTLNHDIFNVKRILY